MGQDKKKDDAAALEVENVERQRAEANGENNKYKVNEDGTHSVHFGGYDYNFPGYQDWPIEVLEAFEGNLIATAVRLLLGPQQWFEYKGRHGKVADLNALFNLIMGGDQSGAES